MMSEDTSLVVTVNRKNLELFYNNILHIVETFYSVTLSECSESYRSKRPQELAFFRVNINPNVPKDSQIDAKDTVTRIQSYVEATIADAAAGVEGSFPTAFKPSAMQDASEDSSYDSDADAEEPGASHRAASRTASDTLAAEFAEYVNVAPAAPAFANHPPPGYAARVEFALKLGYTERLVRLSLQKLGPEPTQNELLAELIKLGAQRPLADSPPPDADVERVTFTPQPPPDLPPLRPIVIDGSNVAMSHGNKEVFSCRGIKICVEWFRNRGHTDITVFVPTWRKEASRPEHPIADRELLHELQRERVLVFTPSRLVGGKRLVCYDDRYILRLASETEGVIVSNDNYRDLAAESPDFRRVVEERLLMYSFVNDRFMPPDDPLGRSGPTLERFLRSACAPARPPQPCPYGRKCTYGNKCKFHHPERGSQPHKSVTERLSERAARALRARLGARDLHALSLPPPPPSEIVKPRLARAASASVAPPDPDHRAALASHFDRAQILQYRPMPQQEQSDGSNHHRKLHRQLTPSASCDPRWWGGASVEAAHAAAARVTSAPGSGSPVSSGSFSVRPPCSSEPTLNLWEARCRMRYHLAGIFPEAQVCEAMARYPEETDAQRMCAVILDQYHRS